MSEDAASGFQEMDIEWCRALYTHGDDRKAGPWFPSLDGAREWTLKAQTVSEQMRRTVRYEWLSIHIEGSVRGVQDVLARLLKP